MINLLLYLILIGLLGVAGSWVAGNPGEATLYWMGWRIDTSFAFLLALTGMLALLLVGLGALLRALVGAPESYFRRRELKHYRLGLSEITTSVAALAAADPRTAEIHTRRAQKLLGSSPLILLLSAQIAKSDGDEKKTRALLTAMLDHKETEYLAARSLSDAATRRQALPEALSLAERARAVNRRDSAAAASVVGLHVRLGQWEQALAAIGSFWRGGLSHLQRRRFRGLVHLKHGMNLLERGDAAAALPLAQKARGLLGDFIPVRQLLARIYEKLGKAGKAAALKKALPKGFTLWTCRHCGHDADRWDIACPECGAFDGVEAVSGT